MVGSHPPVDDARERLIRVLDTLAAIYPRQPGRRHSCLYDLVLGYGRWFVPAPLPADRPTGPEQRCFANATRHSRIYGLTYVEGYAMTTSDTPFAHAWCARPDGTVEDPTWRDAGRAYLGIPFAAHLIRQDDQGPVLFDQHLTDWQFLNRGIPDEAIVDIGQQRIRR